MFNFRGQTETNVIVDGAFDRTPGRVVLQPQGASGFSRVGDYVAFRAVVLQAGAYQIGISYSSTQDCTLKLSVGSYKSIIKGTAPSVEMELPKQVSHMTSSNSSPADMYSRKAWQGSLILHLQRHFFLCGNVTLTAIICY